MDGTRPGFLLYTGGLDAWVLPERSPTSAPDRARLQAALDRWAGLQSTTITYV